MASRPSALPCRHSFNAHKIDRSQISPGALKAVSILQEQGFQAFIVGGAVRDLLIGTTPKDFDIATDASPDKVVKLFHRARIVGQRFCIVRIRIGREVLEVTTFRKPSQLNKKDRHGRLLRDNSFGSHQEDAQRRDFTINALYYDPSREEVIDFHHGLEDIRKRKLQIIGKPSTRYREDPVRMLRLIRLACKLPVSASQEALDPIPKLKTLLLNIPSARLFDEIQKLLLSGHAWSSLLALHQHQLLPYVFPPLEQDLEDGPEKRAFLKHACQDTNKRILSKQPATITFLLATLLWPNFHEKKRKIMQDDPSLHEHQAARTACASVLNMSRCSQEYLMPKRVSQGIQDVWFMQQGFERYRNRQAFRFIKRTHFRFAFRLLTLRTQHREIEPEQHQWWLSFSRATSEEEQDALIAQVSPPKRPSRRRKRPRRTTAEQTEGTV